VTQYDGTLVCRTEQSTTKPVDTVSPEIHPLTLATDGAHGRVAVCAQITGLERTTQIHFVLVRVLLDLHILCAFEIEYNQCRPMVVFLWQCNLLDVTQMPGLDILFA
jgi:hypothetical protein